MCGHGAYQVIEEGVSEERWEGDFYVQDVFDWYVCEECGEEMCCKAA